jgi:hypothetical protein
MAFKKAKQSTGGAALAAPVLDAGSYHSRLVHIIDLGLQPGSPQYPDPKPRLKFTFELMDEFCFEKAEDDTYNEEEPLMDKPRFFHYECTYNPDGYMGENSNIYPLMQVLSPSFLKTGNMEEELGDLLGRPVNVVLSKYIKAGGKRKGQEDNKVTGITSMKKKEFLTLKVMKENGAPANLELVNEAYFFDLDEPNLDVFNKLNKGNQYCDQDKILASSAYRGSKLAILRGDTEAPAPANTGPSAAEIAAKEAALDAEQEEGLEQAALAATEEDEARLDALNADKAQGNKVDASTEADDDIF